jgi:CRISPR-associated protein Cas5t
MRFIYFRAPFAAFRSFRNMETVTTSEFVTHSAAYGFLLGLAGIDREQKDEFTDAKLAIACTRLPAVGRCFQQLIRDKRVLDDGGELTLRPFWREVLCNVEGFIGLDHPALEELVERGINEPTSLSYWGLPFMGDNNLFLEQIEVRDRPGPCRWFYPFSGERVSRGERLYYLSVWTDYRTNARSSSLLFALSETKDSLQADDKAWVRMGSSGPNCGFSAVRT